MRIKEYEAIVKKIDNGDANAVKDALQFLSKTLLGVDAASCLSDRLLDAVNSGAIVVSSGRKTSKIKRVNNERYRN